MAQLEAVQRGEPLARQMAPRLRLAVRPGFRASGESLGELWHSRPLGISRASQRLVLAHAADEAFVTRAEPLLRQHLARSVERLSAAAVHG